MDKKGTLLASVLIVSLVLVFSLAFFSSFSLSAVYTSGDVSFVLDKVAYNSTVQLGENATFLINVTNNGTAELSNFSLGDEYNTSSLNYTWASQSPDYFNATAGRIKWFFNISSDESFNVTVKFSTLNPGDTINDVSVFNESYNPFLSLLNESEEINITQSGPINVTLIYPTNGMTINDTPFSMNYSVNMKANCSRYWNVSGNWSNEGHSIEGVQGNASVDGMDPENGTYKWNVYCVDYNNGTNTGWAAANWTFTVNATPAGSDLTVSKSSLNGDIGINDTVSFQVNVTNHGPQDYDNVWVFDSFNSTYIQFNESSCPEDGYFNGNATEDEGWVDINISSCHGNLSTNESYILYINFTAVEEGFTSNDAQVSSSENDSDIMHNNYVDFQIGQMGDDWNDGLDMWQSSIVSPYVIRDSHKLLNFSLYRRAGDQSCLENLTIFLPENFTFQGHNQTTVPDGNYTFSNTSSYVLWESVGDEFFCGEGYEYFVINVTSTDSLGSETFRVLAYADDNSSSEVNLTVFTAVTFWYNGTVYDINGDPLENSTASLYVVSFSMQGDVVLGTFSGQTNSNGVFNITGVPGLNQSEMDGPGGPGSGDMDGLFYRLSATKYNDSQNRYAMYVGPSLPELPESELRSEWGLNDPIIYLKPAVTFHVQVEGYDYKSGPANESLCNESGCPDEAFNWTNIGYGYGLKDKKLGYSVSNDHSNMESTERYFFAPLQRNYSLMVFPEASFPLYVDFEGVSSKCNSTGYNLSTTGVNATCTTTNGTYFVDVVISSDMTITPLTGYINQTPGSFDDAWIVPYTLGAGNMIFDQDTLPFNMGNMMRWPPNSTYDDHYNMSTGEYSIHLPATEAHSDIMLMAFARVDTDYYMDYYKLSSEGQNFTGGTEHNFTLEKLITGTNLTLSSYNVSGDWNETDIVNTTAVQFYLVDENGTLLSAENSFVEMKMEIDGNEYDRMTDSEEGAFELPVIYGEGIEKLTVYSQSYSPVSTPVKASTLGGGSGGGVACSGGTCNITLTRFDTFDPDDPNATMDIFVDFVKSNATCDVPFPGEDCVLTSADKDSFSPLKAILSGDISMRIKYNNISIHYANTDLLASGPPDAAFSQNASGSGLEAAWKFGSKGPEIYEEVIIGMPFDESLKELNVTVGINLLYDNDFNVIWNASENTTEDLNDTDYSDYLEGDYEAYLNGTGVLCLENNADLSSGLCYKNDTEKLVFLKIPHFTGVGVEVTGGGILPANLTIWDSTESQAKYPLDSVTFYANYTSTGGSPVNGSGANCNASYNKTGGWTTESMPYNSGSGFYESSESFSFSGSFFWNVTCSSDNYTAMEANDTVSISYVSPTISNAYIIPSVVRQNQNSTIMAKITDDGTVQSAHMKGYNGTWDEVFSQKNLTKIYNSTWYVVLNVSGNATGLYYINVTATDNESHSTTDWIGNLTINSTGSNQTYSNTSVSTLSNQTTVNASGTNSTLQIRTGSEVANSTLLVSLYEENPGGNNSLAALGRYVEIGASSEISENLLWTLIKVFYTQQEVTDAGVNESMLRLYYYNDTAGSWSVYNSPNGGVNTSENYVWGNTSHFSLYGVFESVATSTTTTTTVSGGGGSSGGTDETTTTVSGEETTTTVSGSGEEGGEDGKEKREETGKLPPLDELPPEAQNQLLISMVIFIIFVGAMAYWKRHEIFKLEKKKPRYNYTPR